MQEATGRCLVWSVFGEKMAYHAGLLTSPVHGGGNCSSTVREGDNYRNAARIMLHGPLGSVSSQSSNSSVCAYKVIGITVHCEAYISL